MKRTQLFEQARKALLNPLLTILLMALLLVLVGNNSYNAGATNASAKASAETTQPAQPLPRPWTAVASTGAIDEISLPHYAFGVGVGADPSALGFNPNSAALRLQARYNVTNTFDNNANPNTPGWTTLELGAVAPGNSTVTAMLHRIERCSGQFATICSVTITNQPAAGCRTCTFATALMDFTQFLYVVDVRITRPNPQIQPRARTIRIF